MLLPYYPSSVSILDFKSSIIACCSWIALNNIGIILVVDIDLKSSTSSFNKFNFNSEWIKLRSKQHNTSIESLVETIDDIKISTLDNYCANNKINTIDLLKIDTQGYEDKVLEGAKNTIKNNKINNFYIPDLDVKIDLGYAPDYVKAMWLTLQQDQSSDYIISSGSTFSIRYMCDYLFKKLNLNYQDYIKTDITSPQHKFESKGDNSKLQKLGWKLEYDLDFLLDELFKYYQN